MISKQPKYRVVYGYGKEENILLDKDELELFHYAKYKGAFFNGRYGDVDTNRVIAVRSDYKETYGAMPEYQLLGEDFDEIRREHGNIAGFIGESERKVKYLIENKKEGLIGKNFELPKPNKEISEGVKNIANKMKI